MRKIILASASPRRKEILKITGLKFRVDSGDYIENMETGMRPHKLARFLAMKKAEAVASRYEDALIIAADTFIVFGDRVLGKPVSDEDAAVMLRSMSGKPHTVITGFTVLDTGSGKMLSRSVETRVYFKKLTAEEIDLYVMTKEPMDKAGAYAIQGLGALLVEKIEGDFFNVIGLPLAALAEALMEFGINVLADQANCPG